MPGATTKIKEGSASIAKKPNRFEKEIEQLHALQVTHHEKKDDESENEKANEGEAAAAVEAVPSISSNSEVDKGGGGTIISRKEECRY